jgi:hypothetical protein
MKKMLMSAVVLCALGTVGCGDGDPVTPVSPAQKVANAVEGKSMTMEGANIPSHPNGYNEDMNLEGATQCYTKVEMSVANGNYTVKSTLGTLRNAPNKFDIGTCDHAAPAGQPLTFTSTSAVIENVKEDLSCFDVTYNFPGGLKQEGRGSLSADNKTLKLELYFAPQATGHRCADGAVGAKTVTLNGASFTGESVQTYVIP